MRLNPRIAGAVLVVAAIACMAVGTVVPSQAQVQMRPSPTARRVETPMLVAERDTAGVPISASLASKMVAAASRDIMASSLLENATVKASLAQIAAARDLTPEQLLAGSHPSSHTALKSTRGGSTPRVISDMSRTARIQTADEMAFDEIDWQAGVTITPFSSPTYGAAKYAVGAMSVRHSAFQSWQPGVLFIEPPYNEYTWYTTITLYVELPMEPAMYMIAVKITQSDGSCPASWVQPGSSGRPPLSISVSDASVPPQFTPLLDGSGYVGLCSVNPLYTYNSEYRGMRRTTEEISISISRFAGNMGTLVFGGFTITKI